jgi:hypothetical protein
MVDIVLNRDDLHTIIQWFEGLSADVREKTVLNLPNGIRLFFVNKGDKDRNLPAYIANNDKKLIMTQEEMDIMTNCCRKLEGPNVSGEDDYNRQRYQTNNTKKNQDVY